MDFSKIKKANLVILLIFMSGFFIGTISHSLDIVKMGFLGYTFAPFLLNAFWTSLVFIDPLVIVIIFVKLRPAIILAVLIMILDISVNLIVGIFAFQIPILLGLITQIPFGIFVFLTAKRFLKSTSLKDFLLTQN